MFRCRINRCEFSWPSYPGWSLNFNLIFPGRYAVNLHGLYRIPTGVVALGNGCEARLHNLRRPKDVFAELHSPCATLTIVVWHRNGDVHSRNRMQREVCLNAIARVYLDGFSRARVSAVRKKAQPIRYIQWRTRPLSRW